MSLRNAVPFHPLLSAASATLACASLLAGCGSDSATPPTKLSLEVAYPFGGNAENPFTDPNAAFVKVIASGPGLAADKYSVIKPYTPGGSLALSCDQSGACDGVPFGDARQLTVELWSKDPTTGKVAQPILARGRSLPFDLSKSGKAETASPYVTKLNRFAPIVDAAGNRPSFDGRAGHTVSNLPGSNGPVLIVGGAAVGSNKTDAYAPETYATIYDRVEVYEPNSRVLSNVGSLNPSFALKTPRAFHTAAEGGSVVAIVGGYTSSAGGPVLTASCEFISGDYSVSAGVSLTFARAGAAVVRLFDGQDWFLVMGGRGNTPCSDDKGNRLDCAGNTWELIHPVLGAVQVGRLNEARWNHAFVRMPGPNGGYAVLMGGENESGVSTTFEVLQFDVFNNAGRISSIDGECPASTDPAVCNQFFYKPLLLGLQKGVGRTMMGATYVQSDKYKLIAMVGGWTDLEHTKPSNRFDLFDLGTGGWVDEGFSLGTPRAAPLVAAVPNSYIPNEILVAGGSQSGSIHYSSAEFVYLTSQPNPVGGWLHKADIVPVENALIGGNRAVGTATALATGHVLIVGGVGTGEKGLLHQSEIHLWNPF